MDDYEWIKMLDYLQDLHHISRAIITKKQKSNLTSCEFEILTMLWLEPEGTTPLALSKKSRMKKEAVSRCLKGLVEKNFVDKKKLPQDERSYILTITQLGHEELNNSCIEILQPLYNLRRNMGDDFFKMFELIKKANKDIE